MALRVPVRVAVIGLLLSASHAFPEVHAPAFGQAVSEAAKAALKERDRLREQSQRQYAAGKLAEAISAAEAIVKLERTAQPAAGDSRVASLEWLARLQLERGDFAAAKAAQSEAVALLRQVHGQTHWTVTDATLALQDVESRAGMNVDQRRKLLEAERLDREIVTLHGAGRHPEALQRTQRALAIRQEILGPRHPATTHSLINLASQLDALGDYATARYAYDQALAIRRKVLGDRHPDTARTLNNLAHLLTMQGDYAAARPLHEQALIIRKEALGEQHPEYAQSVNNLGHLLTMQGDYAAALPLLEQALAIIRGARGEQHPDYATALNNLAGLLELQGDFAEAGLRYERVLAIRKATLGEDHPAYARALHNLASVLELQGDFAGARLRYEQALAIRKAKVGESHPETAASLDSLAGLLKSQGDYAGARLRYEQALAIRKQKLGDRHPSTARTLNNLATLLILQGDADPAKRLLETARAITREVLGERHPDYATCLNNLALLAWRQANYAEAVSPLQQALEINERNLVLAASVQSARQQLAMVQELRGALDKYLSLATPAGLAPALAYRHVLTAKGAIFERQRRLRAHRRRLLADPQSPAARRFAEYQQTVSWLATLALAAPEPAQARAWRDQVAALARRQDELEAELARLDAGFGSDQAQASRTPEQLQADLPAGTALVDFLAYTARTPPAGGKGDFRAEPSLVAFVIRPDRPIARVDLGPIAPIVQAINQWRPLLVQTVAAGAASQLARELRRLIWERIESRLEGITSILVSPDGAIGLIPLAVLPGKDPNHYLIEERSIAVVPVPRLLRATATAGVPHRGDDTGRGPTPAERPASLLLVGDVNYGSDPGVAVDRGLRRSAAVATRAGLLPRFADLPETRVEMAAVRDSFEEHFPDIRAQMLRGAQATEEAFRRRAPYCRYLHLATHGYFAPELIRSALVPDNPTAGRGGGDARIVGELVGYHPGLLCGLVLTGANLRSTAVDRDDGILTAMEVAELDLAGVDLAVLSACETGLGRVDGGEGILGLQRAFQVAGAQAVVASLWSVGDEPTRALMVRFYEDLWRKGLPPAQALRDAQLAMLRGELWRAIPRAGLERVPAAAPANRLPPFYWAAFVLSIDHL
jgi:CHAT domain-containing protein/Flp pilus assembly protein TadD